MQPLHGGKDISAGVAVKGAARPDGERIAPLRVEDFDDYTPDAKAFVEVGAESLPLG